MNEIARVDVRDLRISTKQSIEIANFIRYRNLEKAKNLLQAVMNKKIAVPFKRFNRDMGHKPGIAAGRYPIKTSVEILKLLNSAESNAENKGLNKNNLYISKIIANQGTNQWHYGRKRRRKMKMTNFYIEVAERAVKEEKK